MKKTIAGLSGIFSGLLPLLIIVLLSFVTKDYALFKEYVSVLGVKEFSNYFNWAIIISGFLIIPFAIYMSKFTRKLYVPALFTISIISLVGIGVFSMSVPLMHTLSTYTFFLFVFVLILVIGLTTKLGTFSRVTQVVGVVGLVGDGLHLISDFNPAIEAIQIFTLTFWLIYSGINILKSKDLPNL